MSILLWKQTAYFQCIDVDFRLYASQKALELQLWTVCLQKRRVVVLYSYNQVEHTNKVDFLWSSRFTVSVFCALWTSATKIFPEDPLVGGFLKFCSTHLMSTPPLLFGQALVGILDPRALFPSDWAKSLQKVEKIQKRALKFILDNNEDSSYTS